MATGTSGSFFVHDFSSDDTPRRVRGRTIDNPLKPGVDQLAATRGKIKANSALVLEPITRPVDRQKLDAAIERAQLPKSQAADLTASSNPAAQRGLLSRFLKG